jgi:hypothetical protein
MKIGNDILEHKSNGLTNSKKQASKEFEEFVEKRRKKKAQQDTEESEIKSKLPEEGQPTPSQLAKQQTELVKEKRTYNVERDLQDIAEDTE